MQTGAYLNPQPVPPRTIAATRMAPAMDPMMRLVALGPVWASVVKRDMSFDLLDLQISVPAKQLVFSKDPTYVCGLLFQFFWSALITLHVMTRDQTVVGHFTCWSDSHFLS